DNKGRLANFKNTIIIMTSNLGSHIIQEGFEKMEPGMEEHNQEETRKALMDLLRKTIRPEFLNRIDETIMFTPLNESQVHDIVRLQLNDLKRRLAKKDITIDMTDEAIDHIAKVGFDPQFGARPVKRVIQRELLNQLSKDIIAGRITSDSVILVDSFEDQIVFRNVEEVNQNI
ncbi:MAG: AAA family ATPase, partial [Bacteroidota bacterium]|nr:AAA family ATPase [Bacteroidota bacterium]